MKNFREPTDLWSERTRLDEDVGRSGEQCKGTCTMASRHTCMHAQSAAKEVRRPQTPNRIKASHVILYCIFVFAVAGRAAENDTLHSTAAKTPFFAGSRCPLGTNYNTLSSDLSRSLHCAVMGIKKKLMGNNQSMWGYTVFIVTRRNKIK